MVKIVKTRESDIVVQNLNNEVLIYDLRKNKALCLNNSASLVWQLSNGERSITDISVIMSQKLKTSVPEDFVWLALEQFKKEDLLDESETFEPHFAGSSRRDLLKKLGLATMVALPVISSVVAPTALHAQSGCLLNGNDFCIAPQTNIENCVNAILLQEMTACCIGTFTVVTFDNPLGSNSCCGTCGPRIG